MESGDVTQSGPGQQPPASDAAPPGRRIVEQPYGPPIIIEAPERTATPQPPAGLAPRDPRENDRASNAWWPPDAPTQAGATVWAGENWEPGTPPPSHEPASGLTRPAADYAPPQGTAPPSSEPPQGSYYPAPGQTPPVRTSWSPPGVPSRPGRPGQPGPRPPRGRLGIGALAAGAVAVVLIAGGVAVAMHGGQPVSTPTPVLTVPPTAHTAPPTPPAPTPSPTPVLNYAARVPGPGCGSAGWTAPSGDGTLLKCGAGGLLMTMPSSTHYLTAVYWQSPDPAAGFSARVSVAPHTGGCGGIGFILLGGYKAYIGYVCPDGSWLLKRYDSVGNPNLVSSGTVAASAQYLLDVSATASTVQFSINGSPVGSVQRASGYRADLIELAVDRSGNADGSATFSDFVWGRQ